MPSKSSPTSVTPRLFHRLYGLETVCLRYFNVYGPRQNPSSPYSGVISIFMTRAVSKSPPVIYGDGSQSRDFVFVSDVVRANLLAAGAPRAAGKVFNIGTEEAVRIDRLWELIAELWPGSTRAPVPSGKGRRYPRVPRQHRAGRRRPWALHPRFALEAGTGKNL